MITVKSVSAINNKKGLNIANKKNVWGKIGHESYRTYDTWLQSIGMDEVYKEFLQEYILPLGSCAFGEIGKDYKDIKETEKKLEAKIGYNELVDHIYNNIKRID